MVLQGWIFLIVYFILKKIMHTFIYFHFFFGPHHAACGILASQPGIEPMPLAVEARILSHCTTREVPGVPITEALTEVGPGKQCV